MRRRGWTRIATVLSGLWLYGASVYQQRQEVDLRTGAGRQEANVILACVDKNSERRTRGELETRCGTDRELLRARKSLHAAPPFYYATISAALWLAMAWVIGWAVFSTVWWFLRRD